MIVPVLALVVYVMFACWCIAWIDVGGTQRQQRVDRKALAQRAEQQHQWWLQDDPRGIYGAYPPVELT